MDPPRPAALLASDAALSARGEPAAAFSPADWERFLSAELGLAVSVRYGEARRTVVRARPRRARGSSSLDVRLNRMFAQAPPQVRSALATWLRSGRRAPRACETLDGWIGERLAELDRLDPRPPPLRPRGCHHDLAELARGLLETHFQGELGSPRLRPLVTWGRSARSRSRHSLRLGSYDYQTRVVRIHPVLDQEAVPAWFVRAVLFHELLHAALGDQGPGGGRRVHHGPEFRRREALYPDSARALAWEERHLSALIASARTGRELRPERAARPEARPRPPEAPRRDPPSHSRRRRSGWVQRLLFS